MILSSNKYVQLLYKLIKTVNMSIVFKCDNNSKLSLRVLRILVAYGKIYPIKSGHCINVFIKY